MELEERIDQWKHLFKTKREEADQFYFNSMFEDGTAERDRWCKEKKRLG